MGNEMLRKMRLHRIRLRQSMTARAFSVDSALSLTPCFSWVLTPPEKPQPLQRFLSVDRQANR